MQRILHRKRKMFSTGQVNIILYNRTGTGNTGAKACAKKPVFRRTPEAFLDGFAWRYWWSGWEPLKNWQILGSIETILPVSTNDDSEMDNSISVADALLDNRFILGVTILTHGQFARDDLAPTNRDDRHRSVADSHILSGLLLP